MMEGENVQEVSKFEIAPRSEDEDPKKNQLTEIAPATMTT